MRPIALRTHMLGSQEAMQRGLNISGSYMKCYFRHVQYPDLLSRLQITNEEQQQHIGCYTSHDGSHAFTNT